MKKIIGEKPIRICPSCSAKFTFDGNDVYKYTRKRWLGLHWFGLFDKEYRFVKCPICKREIRLK